MKKARIGIVCTVRKTFDYVTAYALYKERVAEVMKDETVEWVNYPEMVIEADEAKKAGEYFIDHHVDALIIVSATFHLGHLNGEMDVFVHVADGEGGRIFIGHDVLGFGVQIEALGAPIAKGGHDVIEVKPFGFG